MPLVLYNTLTRQKEVFEPLGPGRVRMYVCGPTVYADAHIGHAMSAIVFDILRRYLEYRGYEVLHVMNFTDVDDKIIQRANILGVDPNTLAQGYIEAFHDHLSALNIRPATVYPRATQDMPGILAFIQSLIDKGMAYAAGGDVYFRVARDEDYGRLSGRRLSEMIAGARVEPGEQKENPLDFALWKAAKPGEPAWDSPWGPGRPGWHIECSAMNLAHLGEQIDIHGGGNDLIFPHHENEIAQTESLTGKPFARYWVHNGMLQLAGEKMSKSLGNLISVEEFLRVHDADTLRMVVLSSSYRSPLAFGDEIVAQADRALARLHSALKPASAGTAESPDIADMLQAQAERTRAEFSAAMDDDLNTAGALAHLFELTKAINSARDAGAGAEAMARGQLVLRELAGVLGLRLETGTADRREAEPFIELLVELRQELRKAKQFGLADSIRDRLATLGVELEDTKQGTVWKIA